MAQYRMQHRLAAGTKGYTRATIAVSFVTYLHVYLLESAAADTWLQWYPDEIALDVCYVGPFVISRHTVVRLGYEREYGVWSQ
jgi:hypothetical protein